MIRWRLCLLAFLALPAVAQDAGELYDLSPLTPLGLSVEARRELTLDWTVRVRAPALELDHSRTERLTETLVTRDVCRVVDEQGAPLELSRRVRAHELTHQADAGAPVEAERGELAERSFVLRRGEDGGITVAEPGAEEPPAGRALEQRIRDPMEAFTPARAVQVGDRWEVSRAALAELLDDWLPETSDEGRFEAHGELLRVRLEPPFEGLEPEQVAAIKVEVRARRGEDALELTGELRLSLDQRRLLTARLEATLSGREVEGGEREGRIVEHRGRLTIRKRYLRVDRLAAISDLSK